MRAFTEMTISATARCRRTARTARRSSSRAFRSPRCRPDRRPFPDDGRARLLPGLRARQPAGRGRGLRRPAAQARHRPAAAHRHLAGLVRCRRLALPAARRRGEARRHAPRPDGGEPALLPAGAGDGAGGRRHGGRHPQPRRQPDPDELRPRPFAPVAEPMRQGGLSAICLAVVADLPVVTLSSGRLRPEPRSAARRALRLQPASFAALHALAREQGHADHQDGRGAARRAGRAGLPSSSRRKAATSSKARSSASTRPISAGRCATAAHALPAERTGRHPDRAQRPWRSDGLRRRGDPPLQPAWASWSTWRTAPSSW